ncbi:unnamed protein product [Ostreobium quekettii]|uniref:Uncharacterized protein n=1 Tax=Ostreobium quekettii TaxID=121088 RepID=A0A8S1J934_9CHLO|nr:unnamed protein product [Ostreobium quekettii]|eukprot:evm.model.scf_12EXC.18 EVM.evm.TU.scf_12EXC.18   scf_12EXC:183226-187100(+)
MGDGPAVAPPVGMAPLLLTFSPADLEQRYEEWANAGLLADADRTFLILAMASRAVALAWPAAGAGGSPGLALMMARAAWPTLAWMLWAAADLGLRAAAGRGGLGAWRTPLVISTRFMTTLEAGLGCSDAASGLLLTALSPRSLLFSALSYSGLWSLLIMALAQPLPFRWHIPVHAVALAFVAINAGVPTCAAASCAGMCSQCRDEAFAWHTIDGMTSLLDGAARACLEVTFGVGNLPGALEWTVEQPCLQLVLFLQLFLGFLVASYFVWLLERRSRVEFIWRAGLGAHAVEQLPAFSCVMHGVLTWVAFGVTWRVLLYFTPGSGTWGPAPERLRAPGGAAGAAARNGSIAGVWDWRWAAA